MTSSLLRPLLDAHKLDDRAPSDPGRELALRVDHVLLDESDAVLVFLELEAVRCERIRTELALACMDSESPWPMFQGAERRRYVQTSADKLGVLLARPGSGLPHHLYMERLASPGKLVIGSRGPTSHCGGLGVLALEATEGEIAVALAGGPLRLEVPRTASLHVRGTLPWWIGAQDLAFALESSRERAQLSGVVLEITGPGLEALEVADRVLLAGAARALGVQATLFPSDAVTRRFLKAQGREPEWKLLGEGNEESKPGGLDLDLDTVEPRVNRGVAWSEPVRVRELAGRPIERVTIGPEAGFLHLETLAALLHERHVPPGVELVVVPGSRQILETAMRDGVLQQLRFAGARVAEIAGRTTLRPGPAREEGAEVTFGVSDGATSNPRNGSVGYRAGLATAAACALTGRLVDPRDVEVERPHGRGPGTYVVRDEVIRRPTFDAATSLESSVAGVRPRAIPGPLDGPIRGVVLLKVGDRLSVGDVLPKTPKTEPLWSDLPGLARHAFGRLDPEFANRARRAGGGVIVCGARAGIGCREARAAIVLRALGVRAVLARSWEVGFRRDLLDHGVLPLRFVLDDAYHAVRQGDELELPTLPEGLEPNRPLVVRNLTQGAQYSVRHDLTPREIAEVRSGGLLGTVRRESRERSLLGVRGAKP